VIEALSEAFEVKPGRAATKTVATTSVTRKTIRATKRPRCVREKFVLMFILLAEADDFAETGADRRNGIGRYLGLFEGTFARGSPDSNSVGF
jgi:hypothetical protein